MVSPEKLESMQLSWVRLLDRYNVSPKDAYPIFDRLVEAYQESHRHYHNLMHIAEMLRIVPRLADQAKDLSSIQLAVWFHDAIYDPKAKDNEERSAALAHDSLLLFGIPKEIVTNIEEMILATKSHSSTDPDTLILLDADLAILGAEEKRYDEYARAIRREYDWVEDSLYREGRTKVLQSFLNRERIYQTQRMHEMGDQTARQNMNRELAILREFPT
jgi:predicted metal-dependent HD superfamily phosphohydrolase